MINKGYILLHRKLIDSWVYQDSETLHLWVHLLLCASYNEKEYSYNGDLVKLKPGQFITGRKKLSIETGINESKIERVLSALEKAKKIEQQTNSRNRCISIVKWCEYQKIEQPANTDKYIKIKEIVKIGFGDEFLDVVLTWLSYKDKKGKGYKDDKTIMTMVNKLWNMAKKKTENAKVIVENSISNNYDGLFPIKDDKNKKEIIQDTSFILSQKLT